MKSTFEQTVGIKYVLYNSLLLQLPFDMIHQTGLHLPVLHSACESGYRRGENPRQIINKFFSEHFPDKSTSDAASILFNVIQYVERQVVLFDAIEDSAFEKINNLQGDGTLTSLAKRVQFHKNINKLKAKLNNFKLHLVLTAHPTQFYPSAVLGIINRLDLAIRAGNLDEISDLLIQLGKTPFLNRQKPTPLDEAKSSIWYLENVFYEACAAAYESVREIVSCCGGLDNSNLISIGFWPGGDRDGNPFVNSQTTRQVALELKRSVLKCYHKDLLHLKSKLTFKYTEELVQSIETKVRESIYNPDLCSGSAATLLKDLEAVLNSLMTHHNGLFIEDVNRLITKVKLFGLHFASLDIRQDSRVHDALTESILRNSLPASNFVDANEQQKMEALLKLNLRLQPADFTDPLANDTLQSFFDMHAIQASNGAKACHRYIISNCTSALHIIQILLLAKWTAWREGAPTIDIIPLFESVESLTEADKIMGELFNNPFYKQHLVTRSNFQTIMLGFSDGTKDGGYLCANWAIYKAKESLTAVAKKYNIKLAFFDGRGGPPARGGGNTHKFYSSLGDKIAGDEIQLTIQGQTISSNFGTPVSAGYNIEQLLTAGIENDVFYGDIAPLNSTQKETIDQLSALSLKHYQQLKSDPCFLSYLQKLGPLDYYGMTNIGSRPTKRKDGTLSLEDLRAIPFVGTWSQLKQNVPGYYGVGLAIEEFDKAGKLKLITELYRESLFFRTLVDNSMQVLIKTNFAITRHFAEDREFGSLWKKIHSEFERTKKYLLQISASNDLLQTSTTKESIELRESIVLPLLTIQQYALEMLREQAIESNPEEKALYQKMVMRTMFGIINASRNSA